MEQRFPSRLPMQAFEASNWSENKPWQGEGNAPKIAGSTSFFEYSTEIHRDSARPIVGTEGWDGRLFPNKDEFIRQKESVLKSLDEDLQNQNHILRNLGVPTSSTVSYPGSNNNMAHETKTRDPADRVFYPDEDAYDQDLSRFKNLYVKEKYDDSKYAQYMDGLGSPTALPKTRTSFEEEDLLEDPRYKGVGFYDHSNNLNVTERLPSDLPHRVRPGHNTGAQNLPGSFDEYQPGFAPSEFKVDKSKFLAQLSLFEGHPPSLSKESINLAGHSVEQRHREENPLGKSQPDISPSRGMRHGRANYDDEPHHDQLAMLDTASPVELKALIAMLKSKNKILMEQVDMHIEQHEIHNERILHLNAKCNAAEQREASLRDEQSRLKQDYENLKSSKLECDEELGMLKAYLAEVPTKEEFESKARTVKELIAENETLQTRVHLVEDNIDALRNTMLNQDSIREHLESELKKCHTRLLDTEQSKMKQIGDLREQIREMQEEKDAILKHHGEAQHDLSEMQNLIGYLQQEIEDLRGVVAERADTMALKDRTISRIQQEGSDMREEAVHLKIQVADYEEEIKMLQKKVTAHTETIKDLRASLELMAKQNQGLLGELQQRPSTTRTPGTSVKARHGTHTPATALRGGQPPRRDIPTPQPLPSHPSLSSNLHNKAETPLFEPTFVPDAMLEGNIGDTSFNYEAALRTFDLEGTPHREVHPNEEDLHNESNRLEAEASFMIDPMVAIASKATPQQTDAIFDSLAVCIEEVMEVLQLCFARLRRDDATLTRLLGLSTSSRTSSSKLTFVRTSSPVAQLETIKDMRKEISRIKKAISDQYASELGKDACHVQ